MKNAYPIILSPSVDGGFIVSIPSFDISTQGDTIADAIFMARDAIGMMGIDLEDSGQPIPEPTTVDKSTISDTDILTLVDVDFAAYRASMDTRSVKKNCTIPAWLNNKAEKAGVNFSKVLQEALIELLDIKSAK